MHVLLLHPPVIATDVFAHSVTPHMPLGIAYIAGALDKAGHKVSVIDAFLEGYEQVEREGDTYTQGLPMETVCDRIEILQPDLIMISMPFSIQSIPALSMAKRIRERFPTLPIVAGGPHATVAEGLLAEAPFLDVVVRGEGEVTGVILTDRFAAGEPLDGIPGVIHRGPDGSILDNGPPKLIDDLDSLAFPLWDAFDHNRIHDLRNEKSITVITSRGCPYSCCFCSIHHVMGHKFRTRSPENVIAELDIIIKKHGARVIYFEDDNMTMNKERAKTLFRMIIERDYKITWFPRNGVRMDTLDSEMLELMKLSGCGRVWIAPESGSARILHEVINKKIDPNSVYRVANQIMKAKLPLTCFFVLGFPQERREDILETIEMAIRLKKIGVDEFWFSCAVPYLGTKLLKTCESLYPSVSWQEKVTNFSTHIGIIDTVDFSASELQKLRNSAMAILNDRGLSGKEISPAIVFRHAGINRTL